MSGEKAPKVSVCIVTYNQENYIQQCLQSVIDQKTDFELEIIVADDCSTDRTTEVIKNFQEKHPEKFNVLIRKKNIGALENFVDTHRRAKGDYVCHLDGDDYWLENKLQSQVRILDNNQDIAIAAHDMFELLDERLYCSQRRALTELGDIATVEDLLRRGCFFHHSSKMYRRSATISTQPPPAIDYYFHIEHSISGRIYFSKDRLGVYRVHDQGISKRRETARQVSEGYERAFDRALELGLPKSLVENGRIRHRQAVALKCIRRGDVRSFKKGAGIKIKSLTYASKKQLLLHVLSLVPSPLLKWVGKMRFLKDKI